MGPYIGTYPILCKSLHREIPYIGSQNEARYRAWFQDIRISGHEYPDIWTHDIRTWCPDILPDAVPDIMTFPSRSCLLRWGRGTSQSQEVGPPNRDESWMNAWKFFVNRDMLWPGGHPPGVPQSDLQPGEWIQKNSESFVHCMAVCVLLTYLCLHSNQIRLGKGRAGLY